MDVFASVSGNGLTLTSLPGHTVTCPPTRLRGNASFFQNSPLPRDRSPTQNPESSSVVHFTVTLVVRTLRRKTPTKKGSWWPTGLKRAKKQSLAATAALGHLPQTAHQGEACLQGPCHRSQPSGRSSRGPISTNRAEAPSVQSELHSSDQHQQLYSDQSEQRLVDQSEFEYLESSFA